MTAERTEDVALRGILTLTMGGGEHQIRTLTIAESDTWLDLLGAEMAAVDVVEGDDGTAMLQSLLKASSAAKFRLVLAYDHEGKLGGEEAIRKSMTKRELYDAVEAMVTAEDPSEEATARSVAEAFGQPSRMLEAGIRVVAEPTLRLVKSLNGLSASGDSTTPATSVPDGPGKSSSSTGRTRRTARGGSPTSAAI